MKKIDLTYKELMNTISPDHILDNDFEFPEGIYVENGTGELIPIKRGIVKSPVDMIEIEFANGVKQTVAKGHAYAYHGELVTAEDATIVDTSFGDLEIISKTEVGKRLAYDIEVPAPHWYVNDENCIYSHNTNFCLLNVKAFLDTDPNAVCIYMDCEFGGAQYMKSFNINEDQVIHVPFTNVEAMKISLMQMVEELGPEDKVCVFIDSVSQVASKKEVDDAIDGKEVADMTRAKSLNSFWRMITPVLTLKRIPLMAINSFYADTTNKYAENIMKGGKQAFLSADTILFVTRSQDKDKVANELKGWNFNYTIMKSRWVQEKSKFSVNVRYDAGINPNSGLFELAEEAGYIYSEKQGFYKLNIKGFDPDKSWRRAAIEEDHSIFKALIADAGFNDYFVKNYALDEAQMLRNEEDDQEVIDEETGEIIKV